MPTGDLTSQISSQIEPRLLLLFLIKEMNTDYGYVLIFTASFSCIKDAASSQAYC